MERLQQVGRYRVEQEVARGGMGAVYRARTPEGRQVALKLLLAGKGASPLQRRRVATEVQTLLRLRHPHVVELLDAGELEGVPYLVMEWIEGETLAARLGREGPLDPLEAVDLIRSLAGALEHCHAQGVLHRDLKPANVLLRPADGAPLLTDFGLSKDLASVSQTTLMKTMAGRWLGTPGYWPPEQARGDLSAIGPRSDVYGLGALLYAALTGVPPQEGETLQELLQALDREPVPPSARRSGVPAWLDAVCLRALASDPELRPASAAELARDLERPIPRQSAREARAPGLISLVAALLGLVALGAVAGAALGRRATPDAGAEATPLAAPDAQPRPAQPPAVAPPPPEESPARTPPSEDTPPETQRRLASGDARLGRGDLAGALADYERVLELDPWSSLATLNRGVVRELQGDLAGARADFDRTLELDPRQGLAYYHRGCLRARGTDLPGGQADLDRAVELLPWSGGAVLFRGMARERSGDLVGARHDYERALELDMENPRAYVSRGALRRREGDLAGAGADFERALALRPSYDMALANRGGLRHQLGDAAGARADLDRAIELNPRCTMAYFNRSLTRAQAGDLRGARADLDRVLELDPQDAPACFKRGLLRQELDDLEGAIADYGRALELDSRNASAFLNRGALRRRQGDLAGAHSDAERALALDPRLAGAYLNRGLVRRDQGDVAGACADFERFLQLAPEDPHAAGVRTDLEELRRR